MASGPDARSGGSPKFTRTLRRGEACHACDGRFVATPDLGCIDSAVFLGLQGEQGQDTKDNTPKQETAACLWETRRTLRENLVRRQSPKE